RLPLPRADRAGASAHAQPLLFPTHVRRSRGRRSFQGLLMSQSFKKTALKALLPALLLGQPGFASVRSSSVSRGRSGRAVLAVNQASTPDTEATTGERWTAPAQSNPFAAFGGVGTRQERAEDEPGAETLAFLEAQGLLSPQ